MSGVRMVLKVGTEMCESLIWTHLQTVAVDIIYFLCNDNLLFYLKNNFNHESISYVKLTHIH